MAMLFPLAIGAIVIAGLAIGYWRAQQRRTEMAAFAQQMGWTYTQQNQSYCYRWSCAPFGKGQSPKARNILTGLYDGRPVTAFDYSYEQRDGDGQGHSTSTTHTFSICVLSMPTALPSVSVTRESALTRLGSHLGLEDIELESEDFNRRFRVSAGERKIAVDILTPRTMAALLASDACAWRIEGSDILAWHEGKQTRGDLLARVGMLDQVLKGIPAFVWADHGAPAPPAPLPPVTGSLGSLG